MNEFDPGWISTLPRPGQIWFRQVVVGLSALHENQFKYWTKVMKMMDEHKVDDEMESPDHDSASASKGDEIDEHITQKSSPKSEKRRAKAVEKTNGQSGNDEQTSEIWSRKKLGKAGDERQRESLERNLGSEAPAGDGDTTHGNNNSAVTDVRQQGKGKGKKKEKNRGLLNKIFNRKEKGKELIADNAAAINLDDEDDLVNPTLDRPCFRRSKPARGIRKSITSPAGFAPVMLRADESALAPTNDVEAPETVVRKRSNTFTGMIDMDDIVDVESRSRNGSNNSQPALDENDSIASRERQLSSGPSVGTSGPIGKHENIQALPRPADDKRQIRGPRPPPGPPPAHAQTTLQDVLAMKETLNRKEPGVETGIGRKEDLRQTTTSSGPSIAGQYPDPLVERVNLSIVSKPLPAPSDSPTQAKKGIKPPAPPPAAPHPPEPVHNVAGAKSVTPALADAAISNMATPAKKSPSLPVGQPKPPATKPPTIDPDLPIPIGQRDSNDESSSPSKGFRIKAPDVESGPKLMAMQRPVPPGRPKAGFSQLGNDADPSQSQMKISMMIVPKSGQGDIGQIPAHCCECDCSQFMANPFKVGHCNNCFHKH